MIEKSSIFSIELPTGGSVSVLRWRFQNTQNIQSLLEDKPVKRISIVAGIRGDAPEGIRVAYQLLQTLKDLIAIFVQDVEACTRQSPPEIREFEVFEKVVIF